MNLLSRKAKDRENIRPGATRVTDHRKFVELVRKLAESGTGGKIDVYQRDTPNSPRGYLHEQSFDGVIDVQNYLVALLETQGPGVYDHEVFDSKRDLVGSYQFTVGKPKIKRSRSPEERARARKADPNFNFDMLVRMMEMQQQNSISLKDLMEVIKGNGNRQSDSLDNQIKIALVKRALDDKGGGSSLDVFLKAVDYARSTFIPQIQGQDTLTTIMQALTPVLGDLLAAKTGVPQAAVDPIAGAQNTPVLPPQNSKATPTEPTKDTLPDGELTSDQEAFYKFAILPFRYAIDGEDDPELIRNEVMRLISIALDHGGDNPHPLVAELCEKWSAGDRMELDGAMDTFFSLIPEISANKDLQQAVKQSFVELAVASEQESEDSQSFITPEPEDDQGNDIEKDAPEDISEMDPALSGSMLDRSGSKS